MSVPLPVARTIDLNGAVPLENGERLTQPEFHRRYLEYPADVKFELIGGVVYMASPSGNPHGDYLSDLVCLAKLYQRRTPGVRSNTDTTTILGEESEPQPDVFVRVVEECGGQSKVNEERFVEGAPEFVAEVAHSSRSIDLNQKRRDYERYGVLEYLVFSVEDQTFHWFHFPSGAQLRPDRQGVYRSLVFPGLWIHAQGFIDHELDRWIGVLERGTSSRAHAAFVRRLERARRRHS